MKRTGLVIATLGLFLFVQVAQADWTPAKRLTWTAGNSSIPAIAIDPGNAVHVVWRDNTPGNNEIYYKRSTDGGESWQATRRLTWTSGNSTSPDIAADSGGAVHAVWRDDTPGNNEIYYRISMDGGATWQAAKRLTSTSGDGDCPAIATHSDNTIHLVWRDNKSGDEEIYYKRSTNRGTTWSTAKKLTRSLAWKNAPHIAADSGHKVHIVWYDLTPDNPEIFYRRSPDGGATWNAAQRVTWNPADSYYPVLSVDSNDDPHVVWEDYTPGNFDIYYKRSTDGGASWNALIRLTWTAGQSRIPSLGMDTDNRVHVVWYDDTPGQPEIYYRRSADGGITWDAVRRLTWTSGSSYDSDMAVDSEDNVHVVWDDNTSGNFEIYYKKGT